MAVPLVDSTSSIHRPLIGSEIRLIHIEPGALDDPLICNVDHAPLDISPSYFALSYVWGDEKDTQLITLNGHPFSVTANLHDALRQLRERQLTQELIYNDVRLDSQSRFWIDAICINQTDIGEKSDQVPRMGKIYGSAQQVLAWLGPNGDGEDATIHKIFENANKLDYLHQQPEISLAAFPAFWSYLAEGGGTNNLNLFCETIVSIIQRPWFYRVWVIQETVLAQEPAILLAGRAATTLHNLYLLWATLRMYVEDELMRQDLVAGIQIGHFESARLMVQSEKWRQVSRQPDLASFAKQLYQLLDTAGTNELKSTLPQDMIYGMLGMANLPPLPENLQPNYDKPWVEVFRDYARFLVESTRNLALLPTKRNRLTGVPSWVPDLREQRFGATGLKVEPLTLASVVVSPDGTSMTLEGVELSTCVSSFQAPLACMDDPEALADILPRFEKVIIKRACRIAKSSLNETLKQWLGFLLESSHQKTSRSILDSFCRLYFVLVGREPPDSTSVSQAPSIAESSAAGNMQRADGAKETDKITAENEKENLETAPGNTRMDASAAEPAGAEHPNKENSQVSDDETDSHVRTFSDVQALFNLLQQSLAGLSHFVATDGSIGMLMRRDTRALQGDRVCVFKGSIYASLIRPYGENYVFLGGCRLNDSTNEEGYDEEFFDHRMKKCFTLV